MNEDSSLSEDSSNFPEWILDILKERPPVEQRPLEDEHSDFVCEEIEETQRELEVIEKTNYELSRRFLRTSSKRRKKSFQPKKHTRYTSTKRNLKPTRDSSNFFMKWELKILQKKTNWCCSDNCVKDIMITDNLHFIYKEWNIPNKQKKRQLQEQVGHAKHSAQNILSSTKTSKVYGVRVSFSIKVSESSFHPCCPIAFKTLTGISYDTLAETVSPRRQKKIDGRIVQNSFIRRKNFENNGKKKKFVDWYDDNVDTIRNEKLPEYLNVTNFHSVKEIIEKYMKAKETDGDKISLSYAKNIIRTKFAKHLFASDVHCDIDAQCYLKIQQYNENGDTKNLKLWQVTLEDHLKEANALTKYYKEVLIKTSKSFEKGDSSKLLWIFDHAQHLALPQPSPFYRNKVSELWKGTFSYKKMTRLDLRRSGIYSSWTKKSTYHLYTHFSESTDSVLTSFLYELEQTKANNPTLEKIFLVLDNHSTQKSKTFFAMMDLLTRISSFLEEIELVYLMKGHSVNEQDAANSPSSSDFYAMRSKEFVVSLEDSIEVGSRSTSYVTTHLPHVYSWTFFLQEHLRSTDDFSAMGLSTIHLFKFNKEGMWLRRTFTKHEWKKFGPVLKSVPFGVPPRSCLPNLFSPADSLEPTIKKDFHKFLNNSFLSFILTDRQKDYVQSIMNGEYGFEITNELKFPFLELGEEDFQSNSPQEETIDASRSPCSRRGDDFFEEQSMSTQEVGWTNNDSSDEDYHSLDNRYPDSPYTQSQNCESWIPHSYSNEENAYSEQFSLPRTQNQSSQFLYASLSSKSWESSEESLSQETIPEHFTVVKHWINQRTRIRTYLVESNKRDVFHVTFAEAAKNTILTDCLTVYVEQHSLASAGEIVAVKPRLRSRKENNSYVHVNTLDRYFSK
jgi:hypothetical protein